MAVVRGFPGPHTRQMTAEGINQTDKVTRTPGLCGKELPPPSTILINTTCELREAPNPFTLIGQEDRSMDHSPKCDSGDWGQEEAETPTSLAYNFSRSFLL